MKVFNNKILLFVFLSFAFTEIKISKNSWKKIDKTINATWEVQNSKKMQFDISKFDLTTIEMTGHEMLFEISNHAKGSLGYLVVSQAQSRYDYFDLMVIYDLNINILKTDILVYREDWGGEITSKRWLKQFIGKGTSDDLRLNHEIQGISGATISCRSAVQEVNRLTKIMNKLSLSNQLSLKN